MTLTFLLTTLWSVEVGVAVSVTISLLLVVHRSSRARLSILVSSDSYQPAYTSIQLTKWIQGAGTGDRQVGTHTRKPRCRRVCSRGVDSAYTGEPRFR